MILPRLIEFSKIGSPALGYISVGENNKLPFEVERVYWTYYTPDSVIRGDHAHYALEQLIIATSGRIEITVEGLNGNKFQYILDSPSIGVYIPCQYWAILKFSHNAVLLCLCSHEYDEADYIRNYDEFARLQLAYKASQTNE